MDLATKILLAIRAYERECDEKRRALSKEYWGHEGSFVAEAAPTEQGRIDAIFTVLAKEAS